MNSSKRNTNVLPKWSALLVVLAVTAFALAGPPKSSPCRRMHSGPGAPRSAAATCRPPAATCIAAAAHRPPSSIPAEVLVAPSIPAAPRKIVDPAARPRTATPKPETPTKAAKPAITPITGVASKPDNKGGQQAGNNKGGQQPEQRRTAAGNNKGGQQTGNKGGQQTGNKGGNNNAAANTGISRPEARPLP